MKKLKSYIGRDLTTDNFVLQMPKKLFDLTKDTGLNTRRVIFKAPFSSPGGFWVKVEPEHADKMGWDKGRVFPIAYLPAITVLEWPVIKILR